MRLPAAMIAALDKEAGAAGVNRSEVIRRFVAKGLKKSGN